MRNTALSIIQSVMYRANIDAPTALVGQTDPATLQLLHCLYAVCEELRQVGTWTEQKRVHKFTTVSNISRYMLPADFYSPLPNTSWNESETQRLIGPVSDEEFAYYKESGHTPGHNYVYRLFNWDVNRTSTLGQFEITPTPSGNTWTASTAYSADDYVYNSYGLLYRCATAGTSGTTQPIATGDGVSDNTVTWNQVSAWAPSTAYSLNDARTNGNRVYKCTTAGTSDVVGGPTGTGTGIIDGGVTWEEESIQKILYLEYATRHLFLPKDYALATAYTQNTLVNVNGEIYKCASNITASDTVPSGKTTGILDDDGTWDWYNTPVEVLAADTDLCLFDADLVRLGLRAKWYEEKGGAYEMPSTEFKSKIQAAKTRYKGTRKATFLKHGARRNRWHPYRNWDLTE